MIRFETVFNRFKHSQKVDESNMKKVKSLDFTFFTQIVVRFHGRCLKSQ